ncbi:MAG TPA: outer membrane lipoprotein-sorting protein [Spirochaetia bacterium]|nr:outer membrane lipoprotein-sorting protein [Spirochaetia bacterium]
MNRSQSRAIIAVCAALALWALGAAPPAAAQDLSADQILRTADQSVYPDRFRMTATLTTKISGQIDTEMQMQIDYKRETGTRIQLLSPPRSRGIRFLQKSSDLWMFNPGAGTGQAIRLSPRASFQGSVFSNRDVGDPQYASDYDVTIAGTQTLQHPELGEVKTILLEGTAKNERVAYSKVKIWVRTGDYMMLQAEYYAKSGLLFKRAVFTRIRELAGKKRPTLLLMTSMDQTNKESELSIDSLQADPNLSDAIFTLAALTR